MNVNKKAYTLIEILLFMAIPFCIYFFLKNIRNVESLQIGEIIPSVIVNTSDGEEIAISNLINKPSIILFFSTTCPACKNVINIMNSSFPYYNNSIDLIAISLSGKQETLDYISSMNILFSVYLDSNKNARFQFRIHTVPTLFIVNDKKQLIKYQPGIISEEHLMAMLMHLKASHSDSTATLLWTEEE